MKALYALSFFVVLAYVHGAKDEVLKEWDDFQRTYEKSYGTPAETNRRLAIFRDNFNKIKEHNTLFTRGEASYTKGVNQFADWTTDEFVKYVGKCGINQTVVASETSKRVRKNVMPESIDWRTKNAVTAVGMQGNCGSCWAFSATGAIEGQLGRKGRLVSLSKQHLVDCSSYLGNNGCKGGYPHLSFKYVQSRGIQSESDYPYEAALKQCRAKPAKIVTKISSYLRIPSGNEIALQEAIATHGPISAIMHASPDFKHYKSGIFNDQTCSSTDLNHAVLVVGYGEENGVKYYIVKNSWGSRWGEEGYFRLSRNDMNRCGIATMAYYPVIQ